MPSCSKEGVPSISHLPPPTSTPHTCQKWGIPSPEGRNHPAELGNQGKSPLAFKHHHTSHDSKMATTCFLTPPYLSWMQGQLAHLLCAFTVTHRKWVALSLPHRTMKKYIKQCLLHVLDRRNPPHPSSLLSGPTKFPFEGQRPISHEDGQVNWVSTSAPNIEQWQRKYTRRIQSDEAGFTNITTISE